MKKLILFLLCSLVLISLNGCSSSQNKSNSIINSSDCYDISTSDSTNSANENSKNSSVDIETVTIEQYQNIPDTYERHQTCGYEQIYLEDFTIVSEYEIDDYYNSVIKKWSDMLKSQNLNSSIGYCLINGYIFIEKMPEEYLGQTDYIVMNENVFCVLSDVYAEGNPLLFIYNEDLYVYNYFLKNGIIHSDFTVYELCYSKIRSHYAELYNLGEPSAPFEIISDNSEYGGFMEIEEEIKSKTDTLFQVQYGTDFYKAYLQ